jgi:hypothetical protein
MGDVPTLPAVALVEGSSDRVMGGITNTRAFASRYGVQFVELVAEPRWVDQRNLGDIESSECQHARGACRCDRDGDRRERRETIAVLAANPAA